jgi:phospholipid/cholesterol/gamma-HCH transport system substrate-binding protein
MNQRAQQVRLGLFLVVFIVLLFGSLVYIAGTQFWETRDRYFIHFDESVAGLEVGAPLKVNGVRVGRVESIALDPENIEVVVVKVSLQHGIPIRRDAAGVVKLAGITGLKFIEVDPGSPSEPKIRPNTLQSQIPAGSSEVDVWTGRAEDVYRQIQLVMARFLRVTSEQNMEHIEGVLQETHRAMAQAVVIMRNINETISENRPGIKTTVTDVGRAAKSITGAGDEVATTIKGSREDLRGVLKATQKAAVRFEQAAASTTKAVKSIDGLVGDARDSLTRDRLREVMNALVAALQSFTQVAASLQSTVDQSQTDLVATLAAIRTASEQLEEFARTIRDNPGALLRGGGLPEEEVPR